MKKNILACNSILCKLLSLCMIKKNLVTRLLVLHIRHLSIVAQHYHLILEHYWLALEMIRHIRW